MKKSYIRLRSRLNSSTRQQGVALLMAMVMLIIATLAGLAGMRSTSLQEKMAGNLYDRAIALQAADLALKTAENRIISTERATLLTVATDCSPEKKATCPTIPDNTFTSDNNDGWVTINSGLLNSSLKADTNPQYRILYLGLKNSNANTDTSQSGVPLQYGSTGGSSDVPPQNAIYRVIARSSQPTNNNDRSVAVVSSLISGG